MKNLPYVYGLIDPRTEFIFYVGKGRGKRMFQHISGARRGSGGDSLKNRRIMDILGDGFEVECRILSVHKTDAEAIHEEGRLIASLPGLTNIAGPKECHVECGASDKQKMEAAARRLLSKLMPFEKWIATATDFQKACAISTGGSLRGWYERLRDELIKESTDASPNVHIQHPDGRVEATWEYSCG